MSRSGPDVLRVYASIRSAHLERFTGEEAGRVLFHRSRYDYEAGLAADWTVPPRGVGRWGVVGHLLRHGYRVVELNEPNMVLRWFDLALALVAIRLRDLVLRRHTRVVAYCIGLTDPVRRLAAQYGIPPAIGRRLAPRVMSALVTGFDRLAFGTSGTRALYATYVDPARLDEKSAVFEALPGPCACLADAPEALNPQRQPILVFVGAFDRRKGVTELMHGWDELRARSTSARLYLIGKGPLEADVRAWAAARPEVQLDVDPPRSVIHESLRGATALALLSQPVGVWREQVGLPIVEALGHGCSVITTSETGLAEWLGVHGHAVLDPAATPAQVADAMATTLDRARPPGDVLADLPAEDQRRAADAWLRERPNDRPPRRLVVMQSFPPRGPQTNPYVSQLADSLGEDVTVHYFSWRRALTGRFDVYHVHWPERPIRRRTRGRSAVARSLFLLLLVRARLQGKAIVRTLHNAQPHETGPRAERAVLRLLDRWTTQWIRLTDATPLPAPAPAVTIAHGHYRDWYASRPVPDATPGRVLYFGLVRRYKGVPELLAAFAALADPALSLYIVGGVKDDALAETIRTAAAADPRVSATLDYVDEPTLAAEIGAAELVVLPYREMHNSGAALLALSLARPVLVPDNEITRALGREVGPGWVQTYPGELTPDAVTRALQHVRTDIGGPPDLSAREWDAVSREHVRAYERASARARGQGQRDAAADQVDGS